MLQSQHFQTWSITQCPKNCNNQMTIPHHETFNETWNNNFPSKETKEKLTLVSTWQYGAWVLGSWRSPCSSCQSNVRLYFLPWKVRKEDPLEEEAILMQRKMGFTKNGYVVNILKNTRIERNIDGDGWGKVEKPRKVFSMRRNGEMKKKNQGEEEDE